MSRRRLSWLSLSWLSPAIMLMLLPMPASAAPPPYPAVMAATGDSITRAYNVDWCCPLMDSLPHSWSTGTAVNSHYGRLLAVAPGLVGHNDATGAANMSDLAGQLATAAGQNADYVTVLMGANDVCTDSIPAMTPTEVFETQFRGALESFVAARPDAIVFVSSIPDIYRLWQILHEDPVAAATWQIFEICQSMLSDTNTEEQRQQAAAQLRADNDALARVCAAFTQCRWDGYAVYNTPFAPADVSTVDYFHPSVSGERRLAEVTWAAGYWPAASS